jgi:hypothetical protein
VGFLLHDDQNVLELAIAVQHGYGRQNAAFRIGVKETGLGWLSLGWRGDRLIG